MIHPSKKGTLMRIHTDTLTRHDVVTAARIARVDLATFTDHGSRSRDHAFEIKLEGESRRRPNGGGQYSDSYAATWDQWGVFLAVLFDRDPNATCWAYDGRAVFNHKTNFRFDPEEIEATTGLVGWWPIDAHGDHNFQYAGTPGQQQCTKCSAVQRWI